MRTWLLTTIAAMFLVLAGCDSLNDSVPAISIGGGIFGLNGSAGTPMEGTFATTGKAGSPATTGIFTLTKVFNDADAGDFAKLTELVSEIGVAVETGDVGLRLVRAGGGSYPASISAYYFELDFNISDANHSGADALGPEGGYPISVSPGPIVFTRDPSCSDASAECPYTVYSGDVARLAELFPVESTDRRWLREVADIVFRTGNQANTPNTLQVSLSVEVTNPASDFTGLEGVIRIGEFDTQIRPVIF